MSSKLPGYDETVICPYNKCHIILKSRIQMHLIKCGKQHPHIKLLPCAFDLTHLLPTEEEKKTHEATCPSRENFDRFLYTTASASSKPTNQTKSFKQPKYDDDEDDWE